MAVAASEINELRALPSTDVAVASSDANEDNSEANEPVAEVKRLLNEEISSAKPETVAVADTVTPADADATAEFSEKRYANSNPLRVTAAVREL